MVMGLVACSSRNGTVAAEHREVRADINNASFYQQQGYEPFYGGNPDSNAQIFNKRVPPLNSLIVCRDKQCAPAELSKSKEYIFNAIAQLVDNNLDSTALLCEANSQAHVCTNPYLTVPAKVGITPAYVYFDGVKIVDADLAKGKTAVNLVLGYNLSYNGQTPTVCKPDKAMLYVKNNDKIVLNGDGFKCDMTSVGTTMIRVMFNVDYIDLDYGYIGGYYSIGLSGPAYGGGSGYGLIRLMKDAYPLNPQLTRSKQKSETKAKNGTTPPLKPVASSTSLRLRDGSDAKALVGDEKPQQLTRDVANQIDEDGVDTFDDRDAPSMQFNSKVEVAPLHDRAGMSQEPEFRPYRQEQDFDPEFDEVDIEDLDDYIK